MCDKGVQTDSPTPKRRRIEEFPKPTYFPLERLMADYPNVALDIFKLLDRKSLGNCRIVSKGWKDYIDNEKHWWRLQLLECKNIFFHDLDSSFSEWFHDLIQVIEEHICIKETFTNLRVFAQFMMEYFSRSKIE